jgi:prepilin-type N-terminal cleavage/methylation domain-containing protein
MSTKGFSIIELLVVIAIMVILFFVIPFSFYKKFKSKAYLEKDVMVYAKNCMSDLVTYCITHYNGKLSPSISPNCRDRKSIYGNVTVYMDNESCNGSKLPYGFSVRYYSSASKYYYVECKFNKGGVRCLIQPIK